jgi:hypothetical protein
MASQPFASADVELSLEEGHEQQRLLLRNLFVEPLYYKVMNDSHFFHVEAISDATIRTKYTSHSLTIRVNLPFLMEHKEVLLRVRHFFFFVLSRHCRFYF